MNRAERYAQVKALRDRGLLLRDISTETGIPTSTVSDLLCDPSGAKARARKAKRHGICLDCGAKTFNSGSEPPKRCRSCRARHEGDMDVRRNLSEKQIGRVRWTDEQVIALVRRVAVAGRVSKPMWEAARAADSSMPSLIRLIQRFDTWGELCALAGVRTVGGASGPQRRRITPEECLRWVQRCADDIGRTPPCWVYETWHRENEGSPSQGTIRNRFGSWMAAAEQITEPSDLREAT